MFNRFVQRFDDFDRNDGPVKLGLKIGFRGTFRIRKERTGFRTAAQFDVVLRKRARQAGKNGF